jgi:hypothetical protein
MKNRMMKYMKLKKTDNWSKIMNPKKSDNWSKIMNPVLYAYDINLPNKENKGNEIQVKMNIHKRARIKSKGGTPGETGK